MEEVIGANIDVLPSHEILTFQEGLVGLQSRLLIGGETLDPNNSNVHKVEENHYTACRELLRDKTTYKYLSNASTNERKNYWNKQGLEGIEAQKLKWITDTVSAFNNSQEYFQENGWNDVFAKLGVNSKQFSATNASHLYEIYFAGENKTSDVRQFVRDVTAKYSETVKLKQDLPAIQWLAGIFGGTSAEVVAQLVDAEAKESNPDKREALMNASNEAITVDNQEQLRINRLSEKEKELLAFVWSGKTEEETTTIPPPQPDDTKPPKPEPQPEEPDETQEGESQTEQQVPNISTSENLRAAHQFIKVLRDPNRYKDIPGGRNLIHDLGYDVAKPIETGWFSGQFMEVAQERYALPMAMYQPGNHAMLLLKAPYKDNGGNWKALIYNPFNEGEIEIKLDETVQNDESIDNLPNTAEIYKLRMKLEKNRIFVNDLALNQIQQNQYDISISGRDDLTAYKDAFMRGKLAALQTDGSNCIPYCHFTAALLNALKPGNTEFKTRGIQKFQEDFGINIRTLEEIMGQQS